MYNDNSFKIDNNITLNEADHKYILKNHENIKFKSVTTLISEYFEEFDKVKVATNLKKNIPKYRYLSIAEIIDNWDNLAKHGTDVHKEVENYINHKTLPNINKSKIAVGWLKKYNLKSNFDLYSETIVYSKDLKLAGTIDLLSYDKSEDVYDIIDWKTSKRIDTVGYKNKTGIRPETIDLLDTNFNHYSLQLSLYKYLLEKSYSIKIRDRIIVHLKENIAHSYIAENYDKIIKKILINQ